MNITTEQIEDDLIVFFNPFVYIAVQGGKTEGGFDIRNINGTHLRFIIFDKKWEDEDKKIVWEETYDVRMFSDLGHVKLKLSSRLEESIRTFCEQN